jgi:hypothetical protein
MSLFHHSKKVTVYIDIIEKYPVFELGTKSVENNEVLVSERVLARWQDGIKLYNDIQAEMKQAVDPVPLNPGDPGTTTYDGTKG